MNTRSYSRVRSLTGLTLELRPASPSRRHRPVQGARRPRPAAVFSADGKTLVTTDADGMIKVWDARTGKERSTIKRFSAQVTKRAAVPVTLAVSPDGTTLATSLADDVPRLWNTDTGRERTVLRREPEAGLVMAFSPDGRVLVFRGRDRHGRLLERRYGGDDGRRASPVRGGTNRGEGAGTGTRVVFCGPSVTFSRTARPSR